MFQAETGTDFVDQAGIGRHGEGVDLGGAPLPGQGMGQRRFRDPALRQQDLAERHVLPLAHHDGLQQIAVTDRALFQKNLPQMPRIAPRQRRLHMCGMWTDM